MQKYLLMCVLIKDLLACCLVLKTVLQIDWILKLFFSAPNMTSILKLIIKNDLRDSSVTIVSSESQFFKTRQVNKRLFTKSMNI